MGSCCMADPNAIRYIRFAQAELAEARRRVELSGFRDSSIGFLLQQACGKALKAGSTLLEDSHLSPTTSWPG